MRCLFFVFIVALTAVSVSAQAKPVTNADLEKYRIEREKAERDYRENYAKLGFPSPEELARRREASAREDQAFADKLRAARFVREQQEAERQRAAVFYRYIPVDNGQQDGNYLYFWSYGRRYRYPGHQVYPQPGYFAGGHFWPTPVRGPIQKPVQMYPR